MGDFKKRSAQGKPAETFKEWTAEHKRSIPVTRGELLAWLDKIEQERGLTDLVWTGLKRDGKKLARFLFGWFWRWWMRRKVQKTLAKKAAEKNPLIPTDLRG